MPRLGGWAALTIAGALAAGGCAGPGSAFRVATGLISHTLCSEVFVSGLDPVTVYTRSLAARPGMGLVDWAVHYDVDATTRAVMATVGGRFPSRAVYRPGLGCLLVHADGGPTASVLPPVAAAAPALLEDLAGPDVVDPTDGRLRTALEGAFEEPAAPPHRWTTAVVVVHDGRIIAERYAPGYGIDTPLLGYSVTKSVTSALVGILVRAGRLSVESPAPVAAWAGPDDPRAAITLDQLLRMTSGLALDEGQTPFNPVARMLYLERDMAGFAEAAGLQATPGQTWNYTSGNTVIVSRIVRDAVGGTAADVVSFARRELFDPLGMRDVTLELDATGTPIGSTYMLASARDWARFGLLYLYDGVVGGRRILPEGWVRYSTTPTLDTGYGAGFWTNRVEGYIPWSPVRWNVPGAPADAFSARGLLGQYVVVIPSARLVVARFGMSHDPGEIERVGAVVAAAIAAVEGDGTGGQPGLVPRPVS